MLALLLACGPIYPAPPQPVAAQPAAEAVTPAPVYGTAPPPSRPALAPAPVELAAKPTLDAAAQQFIDAHNRVRERHCAAPLAWSQKLAQLAQKWANHLRDAGCVFGHSGGDTGENLAAGTIGALDPAGSVAMWADEEKLYRFPNGGFSMKTGHFTQLVWRATTHVGCGHSQCNGNDIYVCEYDPAGNVEGEYADNVKPPGCK